MATAQYFSQSLLGTEVRSTSILEATLFDDDLIRGNGEDERIETSEGLSIFNGYFAFVQTGPSLDDVERVFIEGEVTTTVTFSDGTTLSDVLGLTDFATFNFGSSARSFLLDQDALAAVGKTIEDVVNIEIDDFVDHDLSFADLGFGDIPDDGGTDINLIEGTSGNDVLVGTDADEVFVSGGGNDRLTGGNGEDTFVFGGESDNGVRDRAVIRDFDAAEDIIVLEEGAIIRSVTELNNGNLRIQLEGDRDNIIVRDADASIVEDIVFVDDGFLV